jgi:hypothetical protein
MEHEVTVNAPLDPHPYEDEMSNIGPVRLSLDDPQIGVGSRFNPRPDFEQDYAAYRGGDSPTGYDPQCRHCRELQRTPEPTERESS